MLAVSHQDDNFVVIIKSIKNRLKLVKAGGLDFTNKSRLLTNLVEYGLLLINPFNIIMHMHSSHHLIKLNGPKNNDFFFIKTIFYLSFYVWPVIATLILFCLKCSLRQQYVLFFSLIFIYLQHITYFFFISSIYLIMFWYFSYLACFNSIVV